MLPADDMQARRNAELTAPCVAVQVEESQVERFTHRLGTMVITLDDKSSAAVEVVTVAAPLIYARCAGVRTQLSVWNEALFCVLMEELGHGRIAAHRIYRLEACCHDAAWLPHAVRRLIADHRDESVLRVLAYPKQLQSKVVELLTAQGLAVHPTRHTHELFVTSQPGVSSSLFFGVSRRQPRDTDDGCIESAGACAAEAPCRAFFKLQESLRLHVTLPPDALVLDVGASPGGWTECLVEHGARVVAVDPGELKIPTLGRPITHLPLLLEDALPQLERMPRFDACVCDINVRVPQMAALILRTAPLLRPGAVVVLTLKLGKRPTSDAVAAAIDSAAAILSAEFRDVRVIWLHANTQNERTLLATKR
ncbi:hypothetical protein ATCC90586_007860 [Pythium insidiosum]|nr:hypothetical protein ATCC90586_007860 [Pythium insidiosum]